uniref:Uncharacterized protein n=1 Tax=Loa loa TaxID=7209 RepID=A0A1I7VP00_LOALO
MDNTPYNIHAYTLVIGHLSDNNSNNNSVADISLRLIIGTAAAAAAPTATAINIPSTQI